MDKTLCSVIGIVAYIIFAPVIGGLLAGIDRKITARMQGRIGPSILQPFYDVSKLFSKETFKLNKGQYVYMFCFLLFAIFTGACFFGGFDLMLVFFVLTTAAMFFVIAASVANSPFSRMGAMRELVQMLSYEPMILLVAVGFYLATGTFNVSEIVKSDVSAIAYLPVIFIGLLYVLTIKLRKSPFDLSTSHHAHQEMVKGVTTELSGSMFAVLEITHWYENVLLLGVVGLFIVNSSCISIIVAIVVCFLAYFLEILIDNTSARVKWDFMLKSAWMVTLIAGVVNILLLPVLMDLF
ncbi:MAG: NADH-quinone oxidoreductase subunit H [Lachnospiraceae bacterium]|nr:NADH-quinone oxidoreductase subunit H [Lachnospiraceae bacterium]